MSSRRGGKRARAEDSCGENGKVARKDGEGSDASSDEEIDLEKEIDNEKRMARKLRGYDARDVQNMVESRIDELTAIAADRHGLFKSGKESANSVDVTTGLSKPAIAGVSRVLADPPEFVSRARATYMAILLNETICTAERMRQLDIANAKYPLRREDIREGLVAVISAKCPDVLTHFEKLVMNTSPVATKKSLLATLLGE